MKPPAAPSADPLDRSRFPVDPWRLVECDPDRGDLGVTETLFTVANGYIGMRGNPEEGRHAFEHGTYVNGFHETWPIRHAEAAFGFARTGQTIVNVPDAKLMKLYVDDEPLVIGTADLEHYERALDFRDGVLRRSLIWRTPSGKRVRVDSTRMVSMTQRHLVVLTLEVTMLSGDAPLVISSQLLNRQDGVDEYHVQAGTQRGRRRPAQGRRLRGAGAAAAHPHGQGRPDDARLPVRQLADDGGRRRRPRAAHATTRTRSSWATSRTSPRWSSASTPRRASTLRIEKAVAYHTSRGLPVRELSDRCRRTLDRAARYDVDALAGASSATGTTSSGRQRRRGRRRTTRPRGHPAGHPVQPVPAGPGQRRGPTGTGVAGQGRDRLGLRGPLLLGQRGLRRAVPQLHPPPSSPAT